MAAQPDPGKGERQCAATRAALARCFASADHAEGVAAFMEKRPARFTGR